MSILNIVTETPGLTGVIPRLVHIQTDDTLAEITAANYLEPAIKQGYSFYETDKFVVSDSAGVSRFFSPTISSGSITLTQMAGTVTSAVTAGNFVVFDGTSGDVEDAGYLPSNAAKTRVVMADGATVANNLATFADTTGTAKDAGARIISGTTETFGGSSTSHVFTVTGLTVAAKGTAVVRTSTNSAAVTKALPGTNTLTITFSVDPGPNTTVDYIYTTAGLT
jgi:hypothetical protein